MFLLEIRVQVGKQKHPQERRKSRKKKEFGAPNLTKKQRKQLKSK